MYFAVLSCFSHVKLFATLWTVACQRSPEDCRLLCPFFPGKNSGVGCPPPGDLPNPGIEPVSLMSPALTGGFFTTSTTWDSNTLAIWCEEPTHWKRPWCWERLKVGGEGDDRGWDGWIASPMRWAWFWVNSESWWWTGRPGMLQSMGSQRVGQDWVTELGWTEPPGKPPSMLYALENYKNLMLSRES